LKRSFVEHGRRFYETESTVEQRDFFQHLKIMFNAMLFIML